LKICITGGAGFIGHHVVHDLFKRGDELLVVDNLSTGKRDNLPQEVPFVHADILEDEGTDAIIKFEPEVVLHLAAQVTIRGSMDGIAEDARQNFLGTARVLEAGLKAKTRRFVLASSMAIYDDCPSPDPLDENWPKKPKSPYGISKLASEELVHLMGRQAGISTIALRFFNTFGPGQVLTPYVGVITIFIDKIREGEPPVIFGDGQQCRDFIYVGDVANACRLAIESNVSGESVNIGTGKGTTINEVAQLLLNRFHSKLSPTHSLGRPEENRNSVADITRAYDLLGFAPEGMLETKIDEIIPEIKD
jgi:UDP-glucose 4-epimerase